MVKKKAQNTGLIVGAVGVGMAVLFGLIAGSAKAGQIEMYLDDDSDEDAQIEDALYKVKNMYGVNFARQIERVLRQETAHFSSGGWLATNGAGMEATNRNFPFGWPSLAEFVEQQGAALNLSPGDFTILEMQENNSDDEEPETFIVWPNVYSFIVFLAWFIQNVRGGRAGYWYSLKEDSAARYENTLSKIKTPIVDSLP